MKTILEILSNLAPQAVEAVTPAVEGEAPLRPKRSASSRSGGLLSPGNIKPFFRVLLGVMRGGLLGVGLLAVLVAALQFTLVPGRIFKSLSIIADPFPDPPTHILVMGGNSIGEFGLMRTYFAALAAARYPDAEVLVATPFDTNESTASRFHAEELRLRGVEENRIRFISGGRNTREQALRLADYFSDWTNEPPRILIVTSPEHVRRTAACIRKTSGASLSAFTRKQLRLGKSGGPALPARSALSSPGKEFLLWSASELDTPCPASALRSAVPDVGFSIYLRYGLWANLDYTLKMTREVCALLYYRLRGWI